MLRNESNHGMQKGGKYSYFPFKYLKHHLHAEKPHIQISYIWSVMKSCLLQLFNLFDYPFFPIPTDTALNQNLFISPSKRK